MILPGRRKAARALLKGPGVFLLVFFCFVLGGAAVYFRVAPFAGFLEQAFVGGQAWWEKRQEASENPSPASSSLTTEVDRPERTFDGYTLYTTPNSTRALLINMHGDVVHQWSVRFRDIWPEPELPHVKDPVRDDQVYFWGCRALPDGDLLAVLVARGDTPYGYGLVRLDKDSHVRWRYSANAHHELDLGTDGKIYVLTQRILRQMPRGLEFIAAPCLVDSLAVLSAEGEELESIPILEAFRDSPYSEFLGLIEPPPGRGRKSSGSVPDRISSDILHTNYVQVLSPALAKASRIPNVAAGQVLVSIRNLDTIAVIDTTLRQVVWATRGPWRRQHSPQFLDNGHLLLLDNLGSPNGSRVLEYDPLSRAVPWSYPSELGSGELFIHEAGLVQRLPNGNTLIVHTERPGGLTEVTQERELVWSCTGADSTGATKNALVSWGGFPSGRRYAAEELPFLNHGESPRP